jgi:hypothetical protein
MSDQLPRHRDQVADNRPNAMFTSFFWQKLHLQGNRQILCNLASGVESPVSLERATGRMQIQIDKGSFQGIFLHLLPPMPPYNLRRKQINSADEDKSITRQ